MNTNSKFPSNYIERFIQMEGIGGNIKSKKQGRSSYREYTEENLWNNDLLEDLYNIGNQIIKYTMNKDFSQDRLCYDKKIVSIDIETTNFIPKAREGFVNILGITFLNLENISKGIIELIIYQVFNMLRRKEDAHHLLSLAWNYIDEADILIVFNKSFDINILQTIINNHNLNFKFPEKIIDMKDHFKSLEILEDNLKDKIGFERINTEKGLYKEYYKLFKGQGKEGFNKKIDPIGIYNLMDTLTPIFGFLLMNK